MIIIHKLWTVRNWTRNWTRLGLYTVHIHLATHMVCGGGSGVAACPGADPVLGHNMSIDRGSIWYYPTSKIGKHEKTQVVGIAELIKNGSSTVGLTLNIILAKTGKIGRPIECPSREIPGWQKIWNIALGSSFEYTSISLNSSMGTFLLAARSCQ